MENEKNSLLKASMNYGLITGLIVIVYSLILYLLNLTFNQALGYISILLIAVCIYLFTKQYRDKTNGGNIAFGQAFGLGILIGVFAAVLLSFFSFLQVTYIDPSLINKQLEITQEALLKQGMSEDQIEQAINLSKKMMTPGMMFLMSILSFTFFSAIISLITSAILKKNKNPFENTQETSNS
jgi:hypothetical protein